MTSTKFTRIKGNFSQNRRLPRLGRIRLGLKVQKTRRDGSTVEYPTEVNYFVTPPEVQRVYGSKPTELDIMLPSENEEAIFPQSLAWFGRSKGLRCKGDGETAERLNEQTGQWEQRTCPCEHYKSKDNPKGECTEQGILMFILPKVSMGGTYQLRTGSYNSVVDINSGLDYVRALIGRISMVPLKLKRVARETHNDGHKQLHYTLSLTLDATVEGVNQLRVDTSRILSHAQLQIEGPMEENPCLDPPDITESDIAPDQIDAADLANMDEAELTEIQQKMAAKRASPKEAAPAQPKKDEPKPIPSPQGPATNGHPPIPQITWDAIMDKIKADHEWTDHLLQWRGQNNVKNPRRMVAAGQESLLQYMRKALGTTLFPY
jgi:hypothetical protein